jgi:predicted unusual protein kinase regulating ubiquinone biosynthesis (AarF/ABC1/UbiB family)
MHGDLKPGNIFISEERIYKRYSKWIMSFDLILLMI